MITRESAERRSRPVGSAARRGRAFVRIEGSLVLARLRGDPTPFRRAIADLPQSLLGGFGRTGDGR